MSDILIDLDEVKAFIRQKTAAAQGDPTTEPTLEAARDLAQVMGTREGRDAVAAGEALMDAATFLAAIAVHFAGGLYPEARGGLYALVNVLGVAGVYMADTGDEVTP